MRNTVLMNYCTIDIWVFIYIMNVKWLSFNITRISTTEIHNLFEVADVYMEDIVPVRSATLPDQIYEIILKEISEGIFPAGSLLPSEKELAERFNVSRPSVRVAIVRLVERGYLRRQKGIGTHVEELTSLVNPLYKNIDVQERILARGSKPGFTQLKTEVIQSNEGISSKLKVPEGSNLLYIEKVFTADTIPVILFVNFIPEWVYQKQFTQEQIMKPGFTEPFFEFYAEKCNHPAKYLTSIIRPDFIENSEFSDVLEVTNPKTPSLVIEDIGYDKDDIPLFYSIEHLVREASAFHVIRYVDNI